VAKAYHLQAAIIQHYETYQFHQAVQALHHFCSFDLGSVYLDIIKDRQYTLQKNSRARRSAQTAMYKILESLATLFAPILSHTAEEIWQMMSERKTSSVFLSQYSTDLQELSSDALFSMEEWDRILVIREAVHQVMEKARAEKIIGSGLEAGLRLYVDDQDLNLLQRFEGEFRFVCITSAAEILSRRQAPASASLSQDGRMAIELFANAGEKCIRCWHRRADVGTHTKHPELCDRCIDNIDGAGEQRRVA
jgi:isoleucyl-tRNA synthetase